MPEVRTHTVELPGSDGVLDLTEALAGRVLYGNRTLRFRFSTTEALCERSFAALQTAVTALFHGQTLEIIPDWDGEHSYSGRCTLTEFAEEKGIITLTVECDCAPYRTELATGAQVL